jgi:homopolymeric O-antigen transport system permease protein
MTSMEHVGTGGGPRAVYDITDLRLLASFLGMSIRDKYLGSTLGSVWAIANPLLMLSIYTFVFGYVFRLRVPGPETTMSHTIWLLSGYGPWLASTEALMAGAMSVVNAAGLVKNMAFKTELLPIAGVLTGIIPFAVCSSFLVALLVVSGTSLSWHVVFVIPIGILQFAFLAAVSFFLSAASVLVRDVAIALPNLLTIVLFATPIFYPIDALPKPMRIVTYANPFFVISEAYRQSLVYHQVPSVVGLVYLVVLAVLIGAPALLLFKRLKIYIEARL